MLQYIKYNDIIFYISSGHQIRLFEHFSFQECRYHSPTALGTLLVYVCFRHVCVSLCISVGDFLV